MKAFVLAAGLGTRLRPFTLEHPKALVPVGGVPMLERVILRLKDEGFDRIVINVHHFAEQIMDFLRSRDNFGLEIEISDERHRLLDTGGAILHARGLLGEDSGPFLIHNVDILSDAPLRDLMNFHLKSGNAATLLVSDRDSSRRLLFDYPMEECESESERVDTDAGFLRGWHNLSSGEFRPSEADAIVGECREYAFSGIHVISPEPVYRAMDRLGFEGVFSVIDFYLKAMRELYIKGYHLKDLHLLDIGKPATLAQAESLLGEK